MTVRHGWAVIRIDSAEADARRAEELVHRVTVKEVVMDQATADSEVERLNRLNQDKGAYYFAQATRLRDREQTVLGS